MDGTLVDSNYHHASCWHRAFLEHEVVLPVWRLHRHVGMGGDKYVAAVAGQATEDSLGDSLRNRWAELFDEVIDDVQAVSGARQLVEALKDRGHTVVIASSTIDRHLDAYLGMLDIAGLVDGHTTKDDVEESKPEADLIEAALITAGTREAVMVGDSPWDIIAARRAGLDTIAVLTGGFASCELDGAVSVYDSVDDLRVDLDGTGLA
jgi:HAD superfamily hydrolase (TIGR01549 family)